MEITLEKIELVKDRTGVTYKEAKDALERADGNVVDAIIDIEEITEENASSGKIEAKGEAIADSIKDLVRKGNVSRIVVTKKDNKVLDLPVNAGIIGALVAPWGVVMGVAAAFGFNCRIEVIKDDGSSIDITDKAGNLYDGVKTKGEDLYNDMKEKMPETVDSIRDMGASAVEKAANMAKDAKNTAMDAAGKLGKKDEPEKASEDDARVVSENEDGEDEVEDEIDIEEEDLDIENAGKDEEKDDDK
ncbi:MAG: DUF4342 domain-containing protein [Anaerovoracaceae bacterium]